MPRREDCVLASQLERWASERGDKVFAIYEDYSTWTYSETLELTRSTAAAFQALGVKRGEHVLVWMPTGPDCMRIWFALNYLGAVYVPINTGYRGGLLEHVIENSGARLMVAHSDLVERLDYVELAQLEQIVVFGGETAVPDKLRRLDATALDGDAASLVPVSSPVEPWDTQYIIYTSGTTGPSKGVLSSYVQGYAMGPESFPWFFEKEGDRLLVDMPLFHVGGTMPVIAALANGGSVSVLEYFKTDIFWEFIRKTKTTAAILAGVMTPFLQKQPPRDDDRDHPLRHVLTIPWNEDSLKFVRRFGVDMYTAFNMTEICSPIISVANPEKFGIAGKVRPGCECRVVDENDCEVPPGVVGELVVRTDRPWSMNHGYYKNPEATAKAWRNGWFHTGDGFKYDADGYFYFVDRIKDAIRRRGENISSFEIESEVSGHPAVKEVAAIPVASEINEDEVMVVITPVEGMTFDPADLIEYLKPRMAHFMIPRYVRVVDSMPHTPTEKIQKYKLKQEGITADTWDREAAGIVIKRDTFNRRTAS
ncbi:MAG: AMP-binding protein [Pseudomonadota bacterium]|nr:AMP-binding protein [Pseudomonadota bacterium]